MKPIYKLSSTKELMELLDPSQTIYVDTETSKLGSQIRLLQVYQVHWEQVLEFDTNDGASMLALWTIIQPVHQVWANGTYDFGCMNKDLPFFEMPTDWDDTFYLSRLAFPEWREYSLDKGLTKAKGYDPYAKEGLNKKLLQKSFERIMVKGVYVEGPEGLRPLTEEQLLYAAIDVYELPYLYEIVKHKRDDFVYMLDKLTVEHIQTDTKGMPVDTDKLQALADKDIKLISGIDKKLWEMSCRGVF